MMFLKILCSACASRGRLLDCLTPSGFEKVQKAASEISRFAELYSAKLRRYIKLGLYTTLTMAYPFSVEFQIFDKNQTLSDKEIKIRNDLLYEGMLKIIVQNALKTLDPNNCKIKYLERFEAVISSVDETKQLRSSFYGSKQTKDHCIYFHQNHSSCQQYFTDKELIDIIMSIKSALEQYLGYSINDPKLFFDIEDFKHHTAHSE